MSKHRSKSHNTLRNFLCGNRLQQLESTCVKRVSAYTQPTIDAICMRNLFLSQDGYSDLLVVFCALSTVKIF